MSEPPTEHYAEDGQSYRQYGYDQQQQQYDTSGYEHQAYDNYHSYDQQQQQPEQYPYNSSHNDRSSYRDDYSSSSSYREDRGGGGRPSSYREESNDGIQKIHDTIYITNLPDDVTEEKLASHFGSIGILKTDRKTRKPKIWIYFDKNTNLPKGDATLTYDDPPSADAAIEWFGGKEFMGKIIQVSKAERKLPASSYGSSSFGGGRSMGGRGGRGSSRSHHGGRGERERGSSSYTSGGSGSNSTPMSDGDWICKSCGSNNFARRNECFKCREKKSTSSTSSSSSTAAPSSSARGNSERGNGHDDRGGGRKRREDYGRHVGGSRNDNSYRKDRHERRDRPY